jgi:hypothetical protein
MAMTAKRKPTPEGKPAWDPKGKASGAGCSKETDQEDPFEQLISILCSVRADWEIKADVLSHIGKLVDAKPDSSLPAKVAECITSPDEIRKWETEVQRLQGEVDSLKTEVFTLKEETTATKDMAEEIRKAAEYVTATLGEPGLIAAKAKLYDEGTQLNQKISGLRMMTILNDLADKVEKLMVNLRESADRMTESSQKLTGVMFPKINLEDLSFGGLSGEERKDQTPQSRKSRHPDTLRPIIDLSPGSDAPNPADGERSRNLAEIFNTMEPEVAEEPVAADPMEVGHPN